MDAIQRQQQDIQENAHAISCLVKFCTDVNIGTLPESMYLLKSIVCNMQYILQKHLHQTSASYAQNIALKILEEKFTPSQYIDTMQWLITKKIIVEDNSNLQTEVDFHLEKQLRNTGIMKMQVRIVGTLIRAL